MSSIVKVCKILIWVIHNKAFKTSLILILGNKSKEILFADELSRSAPTLVCTEYLKNASIF